jgi:hypothetical protein
MRRNRKAGRTPENDEEALEVGAGHGTFYTPLPEWVDRIATWVGPAGTPKTN